MTGRAIQLTGIMICLAVIALVTVFAQPSKLPLNCSAVTADRVDFFYWESSTESAAKGVLQGFLDSAKNARVCIFSATIAPSSRTAFTMGGEVEKVRYGVTVAYGTP